MLRKMTEEEIRIRKMENLRMVSLYEFTDAVRTSDAARAKKGGKPAGCTAITVLCDEGEQFTLSELDPYFEELAEQVMKLYEESENRDSILMNPPTRAVLEAGITSGEEPFLKPFFELQGVRTPAIPFASRLGLRFLPLTVYLVNELEGLIGRNGTVVGQTVGWRGKAVLRLKVLRAITEHPVIIRQVSDGELRISVGNYPRNLENLTMDIVVDAERIEISFAAEKMELSGHWGLFFGMKEMESRISVKIKGREVSYEVKKYTPSPEGLKDEERKLLQKGVEPSVVYRLPWGMVYALGEKEELLGNVQKKTYLRTILSPDAEYSETVSWTMIRNQETGVILKKNNLRMLRMLLKDGRVQTFFGNSGGGMSGRYRTSLADKYYISQAGEQNGTDQ